MVENYSTKEKTKMEAVQTASIKCYM